MNDIEAMSIESIIGVLHQVISPTKFPCRLLIRHHSITTESLTHLVNKLLNTDLFRATGHTNLVLEPVPPTDVAHHFVVIEWLGKLDHLIYLV